MFTAESRNFGRARLLTVLAKTRGSSNGLLSAVVDSRSLEVEVSVAIDVKRMEAVSMLEKAGIAVSRYGLAIILLLIGLAKFTPEEAAGIQPLVFSDRPIPA